MIQAVVAPSRPRFCTLLPPFPSVEEVKLPGEIPQEKLATFMIMYRAHCQRIFDTVVKANFEEVSHGKNLSRSYKYSKTSL